MFGFKKKKKLEIQEQPKVESIESQPEPKKEVIVESSGTVITTPIDSLFELIMKRGRVKIKDAAKNFNVKKIQIEEWAKMLEDHDLIEIYYPPIGEPELKKKTLKEEKKKKKPKGKKGK